MAENTEPSVLKARRFMGKDWKMLKTTNSKYCKSHLKKQHNNYTAVFFFCGGYLCFIFARTTFLWLWDVVISRVFLGTFFSPPLDLSDWEMSSDT